MSKREKKEQKKKEKLQKLQANNDDSENHVAEKLYTGTCSKNFLSRKGMVHKGRKILILLTSLEHGIHISSKSKIPHKTFRI